MYLYLLAYLINAGCCINNAHRRYCHVLDMTMNIETKAKSFECVFCPGSLHTVSVRWRETEDIMKSMLLGFIWSCIIASARIKCRLSNIIDNKREAQYHLLHQISLLGYNQEICYHNIHKNRPLLIMWDESIWTLEPAKLPRHTLRPQKYLQKGDGKVFLHYSILRRVSLHTAWHESLVWMNIHVIDQVDSFKASWHSTFLLHINWRSALC